MPNVIEAAIAAETSKVSREIMEPNAAWQSRTEQNMRRTAEVTSESVIALSITGDTQMFIDLETPTLNRTGLSPSYARIRMCLRSQFGLLFNMRLSVDSRDGRQRLNESIMPGI